MKHFIGSAAFFLAAACGLMVTLAHATYQRIELPGLDGKCNVVYGVRVFDTVGFSVTTVNGSAVIAFAAR